jgi:hypothetical protein
MSLRATPMVERAQGVLGETVVPGTVVSVSDGCPQ